MSRLFIADGHADSLMWNRDLNVASEDGHVDFPRLREAGVGLQCFTVVTRGFPFIGGFPVFAWHRRWPRAARAGEWARALFQIEALERACAASGGQAGIARTGAELDALGARGALACVIGIEGAHALEDRPERVAALHARGVRFMSLTHLSNNSLGGSSYPLMGNRPLTALGRAVLEAMAEQGMTVDVAHASRATLDELLRHPRARPFCSHTGVSAQGSPWRNLDDAALRAIAAKGGVVGIIFGTVYLGGRRLEDLLRHVRHAVDVMGEEGVALGSDFDGMVPLPRGMRDVRDVPRIADALRSAGLAERVVEKIMGGNLRRFFRETLG